MTMYPVAVIGAGPAGLAAAMQLSRQGTTAQVFERNRIGGLLLNANLVENYPGFVEGISGPNLVDLFQQQAERLGVEVHQEEVHTVVFTDNLFRIGTNIRELEAKYLVAATGTTGRTLPENVLEGDLAGNVFTDIYPLIKMTGKKILIIGAGDAALDYAINLGRHNQVTILNRGKRIKGLDLLWKRVQNSKSIAYKPEVQITKAFKSDDGRIVVNTKGGINEPLICDYLITAIGREPELGFAQNDLLGKLQELQDKKRLYCIGDLCNGPYRQTALAVGDGIRAAMQIGQCLEREML